MSTVHSLPKISPKRISFPVVAGQLKEFVEPRASINVSSKSQIKMSEFLFSCFRRDTNCNLTEIVKNRDGKK